MTAGAALNPGDVLWVDHSGEWWCAGAGTTIFGTRQGVVAAGRNGSLQRNLDCRITGIHDGIAAMASDRADTAKAVITVQNVVDRMGMAQGLHGQQKRQQQNFQ